MTAEALPATDVLARPTRRPRPARDRGSPAATVAALGHALVDRFDPSVRPAVRRLLTALALLPLVVFLAHEAPRLTQEPLLLGYGMSVLAGTIALFYIAYTRYRDPSEPPEIAERLLEQGVADGPPPAPTDPKVSLIVAVKDEKDTIERCVASMLASTYPDTEVIVVDDGSTDGTREILRQLWWTSQRRFRYVPLPENRGKKTALTEGVRRAGGDVLAFTDSDCVLAPDALARCVQALVNHPDLGAVSGHARALNADHGLLTKVQDAWYEGQFRVTKAAEASFGSVTCVSGPLAVFRREAIYNYLPAWAGDRFLGAPFRFATDRQLTGYVLGQAWVGKRLKQKYADSPFVSEIDYPERVWDVGYVRSAKVWTNVPDNMRSLLKQQARWKKSFLRNLFFTGTFIWRRGPGPAIFYYVHSLWVMAAPLLAFRHIVWAPIHGLWWLAALYLGGVLLKGTAWGIAFKLDHPESTRWRYRPFMSLASSVVMSWLLVYSIATVRRGVWARG